MTVSNNRFERYHSKSHKLAENQITLLPGFEATSHDAFSAEIKPQSSQYQWQYALADHLGNVRVIFTDKNGDGLIAQSVNDTINEVLSIRNYSPFGLELGGSHKNLDYQNPYRFGGKEHSNFTGYSDFGGRWLDKGLGRWNSVDPLGEHPNQVSRSTYSAFWSNPITYNDPDGRCPSCPQGEQASQFYAKGANVTNQYGSWNWTGHAWQEAPRIGEYKPDMADRWREGNLLQQSAYSLVDGIYSIFANTHLGGKAFESYEDKIKTRLGGLLTLGSPILSGGGSAASLADEVAKTSTNAFKHSFKYADRVRMRAVQDPVSHNFPYSFDDAVLSTQPILKNNGYKIFQQSGTMNGKNGVFEIGLTKDGIIDHRFFRPIK